MRYTEKQVQKENTLPWGRLQKESLQMDFSRQTQIIITKYAVMKLMKKILAMILAAMMLLALAACGTTADETSAPPSDDAVVSDAPAEESEAPSEPAEAQYLVGICQQMTHDALDSATQGFKDALADILGEGAVEYSEGNAGGEQPNCVTIIDGLVSENVDLILANATWPLQAAHSATSDIPVLGTSVTDYATALDIDDWTGTVGGNISGTSDLVAWSSRRR